MKDIIFGALILWCFSLAVAARRDTEALQKELDTMNERLKEEHSSAEKRSFELYTDVEGQVQGLDRYYREVARPK